jgi:hypothetical protein
MPFLQFGSWKFRKSENISLLGNSIDTLAIARRSAIQFTKGIRQIRHNINFKKYCTTVEEICGQADSGLFLFSKRGLSLNWQVLQIHNLILIIISFVDKFTSNRPTFLVSGNIWQLIKLCHTLRKTKAQIPDLTSNWPQIYSFYFVQ